MGVRLVRQIYNDTRHVVREALAYYLTALLFKKNLNVCFNFTDHIPNGKPELVFWNPYY